MKEVEFVKVLDKMCQLVSDDGYVVFDVMNRRSICYLFGILQLTKAYAIQCVRWLVKRRFTHMYPSHMFSQRTIENELRKIGFQYNSYKERQVAGGSIFRTPKVLYVCSRKS